MQKRKAEEEAGGGAGGDDAPAAERDKEKGAAKREKAPSGPIYYRVTVKDNGKGMAHEDIPNMLGRVLSGTKYGVRQARGKFGLGAKMALIWAKQTTGQPITVRSAKPGQSFVSAYTLDLDLRTNAPHIHAESKEANPELWHGSQVSVLIRGAWSTYGSRIVKYLRQLAVITPYAQLTFKYASEGGGRADVSLRFRRRTEHMPPPPAETAYHPSAVDLETIRALMRNTACKTMRTFLCRGTCHFCLCVFFCADPPTLLAEFTSIDGALADRLLAECGHEITASGDPKVLKPAQVMALHRLLAAAKFDPPSADCLSPAGEYNLRLGVMKELRPELVATYCGKPPVLLSFPHSVRAVCLSCLAGPPGACEGHPFMVEAAVSLGGRDVKPGLNIFRFANRIPLLFEPGSDVVSKQAQEVDWGRYKIEKGTARVGVFVSVVSTRVPFRGTGKEHIAEDVKELAEEARRIGQRAWLAVLTRAAGAACADQEGAAAVRAPAVQEAGQAPGAPHTQARIVLLSWQMLTQMPLCSLRSSARRARRR